MNLVKDLLSQRNKILEQQILDYIDMGYSLNELTHYKVEGRPSFELKGNTLVVTFKEWIGLI